MSEFVGEFEVTSRLTDHTYHCRFSHLWNGIATRHSDTVDTKFLVDGNGAIVGLGAHGVRAVHRRSPAATCPIAKPAYIAAHYLREQLEQEDERPLYDASAADVMRIIGLLGIQ